MKNIIFTLILVIIYLLCTVKHKKEFMHVHPSDIKISFYEEIPSIKHNSEIIITRSKFDNPNYLTHSNNMIYVNKSEESGYEYNYRYKNKLYFNDFRWKYVGIFIIKDFDDYSREWLRNNLRTSPFLYKIIYIYSDKENKYNTKLFPYLDFACTLVIYATKPYKRYQIGKTHIITPRKLNHPVSVTSNATAPYLKLYIDKNKMVVVVKEKKEIIDTFTLETDLDKIIPNNQAFYPAEREPIKWKYDGIPDADKYFTKWYDSVFDDWFSLVLKHLKDGVNRKQCNIKKLELPSNYMNYLYVLHRTDHKGIKLENIVNEIIRDLNLPMKSITK